MSEKVAICCSALLDSDAGCELLIVINHNSLQPCGVALLVSCVCVRASFREGKTSKKLAQSETQ